MRVKVIIPFRQRENGDPRRQANLDVVMAWWWSHGFTPSVVSDGLSGDAQFNRHRAYNRAFHENPSADVLVFTEADMLIHPDQINAAVVMAEAQPGLVVPFTEYRYLSDESTEQIRYDYVKARARKVLKRWALPPEDPESLFQIEPESRMVDGDSIGAVNVVSTRTLVLTGGFTEATSGNWYDDNIIEEGFAYLTRRRTRWVSGPAVHLYHLPGWTGGHLTDADKAATAHNRNLLIQMRADIRMKKRDAVRDLMAFRAE